MNEDRKITAFVWAIIGVLIVFIAIFYFSSIKSTITGHYIYEGPNGKFTFEIKEENNLTAHILTLYTQEKNIEKTYRFPLRYGPKELEDILVTKDIKNKFLSKSIEGAYLTMDPDLSSKTVIAAGEIVKTIGYSENSIFNIANPGVYNLPILIAFIKQPENKDLIIKTCDDTTEIHKVIWLKLSDQTRISYQNNCVIVEGKTEDDIIKAADRLVLTLLGVMPN